ncbi:MAG TPA: cysteine methyltransferase [Bacteroidales bacterium]|nr:cysteine methyltransferase [Bacteroidales bacterium]
MHDELSFFEKVYAVVREIPSGRITTYGAIARYLAASKSARMVGWAMNNAHDCKEYVPAHRVVNRQGLLTGKVHFGSSDAMQMLLEKEGVRIEKDRVLDFAKLFWDPAIELKL